MALLGIFVADAREAAVGEALATEFFEVVPEAYETFCSLASRISVEVFRQFAIPANLLPCQLWHVTPESNYVQGFVGAGDADRWDGHVVCMTQGLLVDAAVRSFRRDFAFQVPAVAVASRLTVPSQVIARTYLGDGRRLWWLNAPYGVDTTPPLEPVELIGEFADAIVARIKRRLGDPAASPRLVPAPHRDAA